MEDACKNEWSSVKTLVKEALAKRGIVDQTVHAVEAEMPYTMKSPEQNDDDVPDSWDA